MLLLKEVGIRKVGEIRAIAFDLNIDTVIFIRAVPGAVVLPRVQSLAQIVVDGTLDGASWRKAVRAKFFTVAQNC